LGVNDLLEVSIDPADTVAGLFEASNRLFELFEDLGLFIFGDGSSLDFKLGWLYVGLWS